MPQAVSDVHDKIDAPGRGYGARYLREIGVDILLRAAVGDIDRLYRTLAAQRLFQQRQALAFCLLRAESEHAMRSLLFRQQIEQGDGRKLRLRSPLPERVARWLRIRSEHCQQQAFPRRNAAVSVSPAGTHPETKFLSTGPAIFDISVVYITVGAGNVETAAGNSSGRPLA